MTRVALLWHMHQPYYEDLVTREHILPWVRMHALKDYYGMVRLLREFPDMRVTFNLVPSLLVQLEAFARGSARDRYLETSLKPADALSSDDVQFMLENFFHAQRQRMIDANPRYAELLALRGDSTARNDLTAAAKRFTEGALRDLQVWQKLAWIDPFYVDEDDRVRALIAKSRGFSEDDKAQLALVESEILNAVIPTYRERAEAGQIEISTSPFYHPILPLLCDTDVYRQTHPLSRMPRHRFLHPEDAAEQLERAAVYHERLFGKRPAGLWPSEGSVSNAMIPLAVGTGFEWMATDELILARTLNTSFTRDAAGHLDRPGALYAPYRVTADGSQITCAFRDHGLSDAIGFTYAGWPAERAADDFVARIVEGGRRAESGDGEPPTVFVILDGENAWEHFEGGGRPFLRALYGRLSGHPEIETVRMGDACRSARRTLSGIFPGSWIDANFYIWIGHDDDRRAWDQLAEARAILETAPSDGHASRQAHDEVLIAEGSDWCWWYGDDHSSDHDAEFDDLFRRHLRNVYRLLGRPVPDDLFVSNITTGAIRAAAQTDPTGVITPTIDGEESSYFEWLVAGRVDIRALAGAMHQAERRAPIFSAIRFGFDSDRLYIRLDGHGRLGDLLSRGYTLGVTALEPKAVRFVVSRNDGKPVARLYTREGSQDEWREASFDGEVGVGSVVEFAIPLSHFGPAPSKVCFVATAEDASGQEVERHPGTHPVRATVPDSSFEARNWTA